MRSEALGGPPRRDNTPVRVTGSEADLFQREIGVPHLSCKDLKLVTYVYD